jgi:N-acyl-D-amino-acid deacylase
MKRGQFLVGPIVLLGAALGTAGGAEAKQDTAKAAVEKGLQRIEQGAASYIGKRKCFSCHHQALSILSLASARKRGFAVEAEKLTKQLEFTVNTFKPKNARIAKGQAVEGASTMAVYALFALEQGGYPADETTAALVEYLLVRQKADGSWPAIARRPPQEGSSFTNTALAIPALRKYGPGKDANGADKLRARIAAAISKGSNWLRENEPETTEDMVFHLRGLVSAGADKKEVALARKRLLKMQRKDGSWAQLSELAGDAYATGSAVMALRSAGMVTTDPVYRKAAQFLLATQRRDDGAWIVTTRSRPVQVFFDNGDPGGKSQFISFAATNWAVLALLERYPVE